MIRFSNLTLARGAKVLLEGADLTLHQGERVGLIGANGSGKSSLFSLLGGELHADKGDVELPAHWRIAHVAQETPALDRAATEYAIDGDAVLRELEARLAVAEADWEVRGPGDLLGTAQSGLPARQRWSAAPWVESAPCEEMFPPSVGTGLRGSKSYATGELFATVMSCLPLGLKATERTRRPPTSMSCVCRPVSVSHTHTCPSCVPAASRLPSGENARHVSTRSKPVIDRTSSSVHVSHT